MLSKFTPSVCHGGDYRPTLAICMVEIGDLRCCGRLCTVPLWGGDLPCCRGDFPLWGLETYLVVVDSAPYHCGDWWPTLLWATMYLPLLGLVTYLVVGDFATFHCRGDLPCWGDSTLLWGSDLPCCGRFSLPLWGLVTYLVVVDSAPYHCGGTYLVVVTLPCHCRDSDLPCCGGLYFPLWGLVTYLVVGDYVPLWGMVDSASCHCESYIPTKLWKTMYLPLFEMVTYLVDSAPCHCGRLLTYLVVADSAPCHRGGSSRRCRGGGSLPSGHSSRGCHGNRSHPPRRNLPPCQTCNGISDVTIEVVETLLVLV